MKNTANIDHCATMIERIRQLRREIDSAWAEIQEKNEFIIAEMGTATAGTIDGKNVCIVADAQLAMSSKKYLMILPEE